MTTNKKLIIIFVAIFTICVLCVFILNTLQPDKSVVVILVDGEVYDEIDLSEDQSFDIKTERGTNKIQVKNGQIRITEATCPDKLCMRHGQLHNKYDTIVCLPNKLIIEYKNSTGIDAVAGR